MPRTPPRLQRIGCRPVERAAFASDLLVTGYAERALAELNAALGENPELGLAWFLKGLVLVGRDDVAGAARCLRYAVHQDPDLREAWLWLTRVLQELGRLREGLRAAERVVRLSRREADPHAEAEAQFLRGNLLAAMGRRQKAVAAYRQAAACDPSHSPSRRELGRLLAELGRETAALDAATEAERLGPRDIEAKLLLADLLRKRGDWAGARRALDAAARLAPDDPAPLEKTAELLVEQGVYEDALPFLRMALHGAPERAKLYLDMARIYLKLRRPAEASALLEAARSRGADSSELQRFLEEANSAGCFLATDQKQGRPCATEPSDP